MPPPQHPPTPSQNQQILQQLGLDGDWQVICPPLGCKPLSILDPLHSCRPTGAWVPAPIATICQGVLSGPAVTGWKAKLLLLGFTTFLIAAPAAPLVFPSLLTTRGGWVLVTVIIRGTQRRVWRWQPGLPPPP